MNKILLILMSLVIGMNCLANDYDPYYDRYMQEAWRLLSAGDHEKAREAYYIYMRMTNKTNPAFESQLVVALGAPILRWNPQTQTITFGDNSYRMVSVPGGTFRMGAVSGQEDPGTNEYPDHSVTLSGYCIGATEVPQWLWEAVMISNPSYFKGVQLPVETVSWDECQAFVSRLNDITGAVFSLPTEAQWEYAAREAGAGATQYSGNNNIDAVAWYWGDSDGRTHEVGTKPANSLGLQDMSGNVYEWCGDRFGDYSAAAQTNPTGPDSGAERVFRGGSWFNAPKNCRVSARGCSSPSRRLNCLGFRLALQ